jgi:hypothetical protein
VIPRRCYKPRPFIGKPTGKRDHNVMWVAAFLVARADCYKHKTKISIVGFGGWYVSPIKASERREFDDA